MTKAARRRPTTAQLAVMRTRLRAARRELEVISARREPHPTGRFIQCWAVSGRPVTQALDDQGQVWERVWRKATATTPEESFWEPISMERRDKVKKEPQA
jgi:hypothetical protein